VLAEPGQEKAARRDAMPFAQFDKAIFNRAIAFLSPAIISQWEKAASHSKKAIADLQEATVAPEEARAQPDPATATLDAVPRQQKMLASL
jgi:hypothetical protein